jgi:uncharacterized protein (TIGR00295 family)
LSNYPSSDDCYRIMREEKVAPVVVRHMCVVNVVALAIARRCGANLDLVNAASLLHDIGRSRTHGIQHVWESVRIAREHNLPDDLVLCIGRHIASGFTPEEAKELGLPDGEYMPVTLEDKVVSYADNLVSDRSIKTAAQAAERMRSKGFELSATRMLILGRELAGLCGEDIDILLEKANVRDFVAKNCDGLV